jgi:hypothetical protein
VQCLISSSPAAAHPSVGGFKTGLRNGEVASVFDCIPAYFTYATLCFVHHGE